MLPLRYYKQTACQGMKEVNVDQSGFVDVFCGGDSGVQLSRGDKSDPGDWNNLGCFGLDGRIFILFLGGFAGECLDFAFN